jgi:hypothetical protein
MARIMSAPIRGDPLHGNTLTARTRSRRHGALVARTKPSRLPHAAAEFASHAAVSHRLNRGETPMFGPRWARPAGFAAEREPVCVCARACRPETSCFNTSPGLDGRSATVSLTVRGHDPEHVAFGSCPRRSASRSGCCQGGAATSRRGRHSYIRVRHRRRPDGPLAAVTSRARS